eukprot:TRINITY_DN7629_c0_g1_i1.p1 TRINITY_DN7629_c0_g1~~TRINITY_DN7629_c0_g1_i1.p1  ORF type:complete len:834 (+),score=104.48 TRINITY_DN7629_c0_g1_i1:1-2502(+)
METDTLLSRDDREKVNNLILQQQQVGKSWSTSLSNYFDAHVSGRLIDIAMCFFSIFMVVLYVIYLGEDHPEVVVYMIAGLLFVFVLYYILQFFLAVSKLYFFISFASVIDILVVVPAVLSIILTPHMLWNGYWMFFHPFVIFKAYYHLIKLLKMHMVNKHFNAVQIHITHLYLSILCMIFACSGWVYVVEFDIDNDIETFDKAFYFVMVTLSTVGYGDITPTTFIGRCLVIGLIIATVTYVPLKVGDLVSDLNDQPEDFGKYKPVKGHPHVILTGYLNNQNTIDFIQEFYDRDRGESNVNLVIMSREDLSTDLKIFLQDPFYKRRVTYIKGGNRAENDLTRIRADSASSVFILNKKVDRDSTGENDAGVILQLVSIRSYNPSILSFVQINEDINIHNAKCAGATVVICTNEFKLGLFAKSAVCHGFSTLATVITRSYSSPDIYLDKYPQEKWLSEYAMGADQEIYRHLLPYTWSGKNFIDCASFVYENSAQSILLFGIRVDDRVLLNPDYVIQGNELGFFLSSTLDSLESFISVSSLVPPNMNQFDSIGEDIVEVLLDEQEIQDHIIVSGSLNSLKYFIKPLRCPGFNETVPIMILHNEVNEQLESELREQYNELHFHIGSPLNWNDLLDAGIERASAFISLSKSDSGSHYLDDASVILPAISIKNNLTKSKINIVVELYDRTNLSLVKGIVSQIHSDVPDTLVQLNKPISVGYGSLREFHLSPGFINGTVYSSLMLDSLLCQVFFNPDVLEVLQEMILSDTSNITLKTIPKELHGRSYGSTFRYYTRTNVIPMGLLRHNHNEKPYVPYVFVNPDPSAVVHQKDKIYLIERNR